MSRLPVLSLMHGSMIACGIQEGLDVEGRDESKMLHLPLKITKLKCLRICCLLGFLTIFRLLLTTSRVHGSVQPPKIIVHPFCS